MTVHEFLHDHARQHPDSEFAIGSGQRLTYAAAREKVSRIADALTACGLKPGDRIVTILRNSLDTILLSFGAFEAGVVLAPINHRLTPREWWQICEDTEAKLLVCDPEFGTDVDAIRDEFRHVQSFIMTSQSASPGWRSFDDWITITAATEQTSRIDIVEDDDVLQFYTSGTTGAPKGVVLTHRAVTENLGQLNSVVQYQPGERFLLLLPLFHAAGMMTMLHAVSCGAALCVRPSFQSQDVLQTLSRDDIAATMMIPTMIEMCLREAARMGPLSFDHLRLIIYGASPIEEQTLRAAIDLFQCDFAQRYGTTETLCVAWLDPADHRRALNGDTNLLRSAGRPVAGIEIRVVDEQGREVPAGESGEFIVRGPQLMKGYWNSPTKTRESLKDGWLHTGDAGFIDQEGYIYICDRVKDVIVSGAENIYPREIEEVLMEHPGVEEAAVIGIPDRKWGEAIHAVVVRVPDSQTDAEQLMAFCRERLARFKVPRSVEFVDRFPRNSIGKLLKRELRAPYWRDRPRQV